MMGGVERRGRRIEGKEEGEVVNKRKVEEVERKDEERTEKQMHTYYSTVHVRTYSDTTSTI